MEYKKSKGNDSYGYDCGYYPNKSIEELKEICDNNDECVGFNSLGYLKKNTSLITENSNLDLYVCEKKIDSIVEAKKIKIQNIKRDITFVILSCKR